MKHPLWMPKGSVQALIALLFVVGLIALIAVSVLRGDGELSPALAALVGLTGSVVSTYFEKRSAAAVRENEARRESEDQKG